ncbi:MAG: BREX-1 system adenine-specific DNA-methyltransferase PglX, partial [Sarcina sp.]
HAKLTPEDIKVLDPCMGSGHILVYAFDVLYEIYKVAGYSEREIPKLILKNNIYGLDIDDRATQLASFALIMKARHYNRRLFREIERENLDLNICSIQESNSISKEAIEYFCSLNTGLNNAELKADLEYLIQVFTDAKEYGSILEVEKVNFENLKQRLEEVNEDDNLMFGDYRKVLLEKLPTLIKQGMVMSSKYEVCVTNPPYMGGKGMGTQLSNYVKKIFVTSKNDMFSVFINRGFLFVKDRGFNCQVTMQSWMFLSSFEKMREEIIKTKMIQNLLYMDNMVMGIAFGTAATVFRNCGLFNFKGIYNTIKYKDITEQNKPKEFPCNENLNTIASMADFTNIEGAPIAYWASESVKKIFKENKLLRDIAEPRQGLATGDNERFLKLWYEVNKNNFGLCVDKESFIKNKFKWAPCNKGGAFRRWYGNNIVICNWFNDGIEMKNFKGSVIRNERYYFKEGLTWSTLTSSLLSMRYSPAGFVFETKGSVTFPLERENIWYLLGILNSKIVLKLIKMISPTIDYHEGPLGKLPINIRKNESIDLLVEKNIQLARNDWDLFEISWDFKKHPLLLNSSDKFISESFNSLENDWNNNFNQLKANEEELNRIFIDIYGLSDELTPEVEDKDVTIRKADREREVRSFISYAVGCMLGRYSLDADGLIYAGGEWSEKWSVGSGQCSEDNLTTDNYSLKTGKVRKIEKDDEGNIISDLWVGSRFMPDADNIIPITEDEYFEDDIVARFIEFVKTVYGEDTLEENLDYIADSIARKASETSRQAIRRYFIKDFYKDHLKIYQKRPIYWMFESGKNNGFKCLVYMHRYNKQTVAKVRTDYIHTLQRKYESEINRLTLVVDSEEYSAKDRAVAKKKIDKISKQIEECREYDQVVAYLANEQIGIDLDDGVKVNYAKFQDVEIINSKDKKVKMNLLSKI